MTPENTIRIALTKGRLEKKTLALLEHSGYDVSELRSGSRKLIFRLPDSNIELVLSKAADVITYVEQGVCDMGVVGKDTIMEKGGAFYETLDLGFGKCRMAEAAPVGFREDRQRPLRVATKYPSIARRFYAAQSREIEIIKLNGSIELAPLLGLSDVIVDIVETGTTLRENDLKVITEFMPISARFIANKASYPFKKKALTTLLEKLQEVIG